MVGSISRLLAVVVRDGVHGGRLAHAGAFAADLLKRPGLYLAADFLKDAKQLRRLRHFCRSRSLLPRLSGIFPFTAATFEQDVLGALAIDGIGIVSRLIGDDDLLEAMVVRRGRNVGESVGGGRAPGTDSRIGPLAGQGWR